MKLKPAIWAFLIKTQIVAIVLLLASTQTALALAPSDWPTTYWLHQEVSTVIPTNSWQYDYGYTPPPPSGDVDQAENTSTSVKPKASTSEYQWWPGVSNRTTSGRTNGYGWIFDTTLDGKYDSGQIWTFYVRLRLASGNAPTGTARAYVFRYDGASTYTPLFTATSSSITPTSTATTYSFTYTPGTDLDMQGQYLYVHYTWQTCSTSCGGNNATVVAFHTEGTGLAAAEKPRIIPGSSSIDALGNVLAGSAAILFVAILVKRKVLYVRRSVIPC